MALQLDPQTAGALRAAHAEASKQVTGQLSQLSQVELALRSMSALTEIGRFDKLRYMRGSDPLPWWQDCWPGCSGPLPRVEDEKVGPPADQRQSRGLRPRPATGANDRARGI
jgi:hypothetical protein